MQILYKSSTRNFSIVFSGPVGILHRMTHQIEGDSFIKVANMPVRTPAPDPPGWSDPGPSSPHNSRDASPFFLKKETPCGPEGARRVERSRKGLSGLWRRVGEKTCSKPFSRPCRRTLQRPGSNWLKGGRQIFADICPSVQPFAPPKKRHVARHAISCRATSRHAISCRATSRHAALRHGRPGRGRVTPPGRAASAPRHASPPATEPGEGRGPPIPPPPSPGVVVAVGGGGWRGGRGGREEGRKGG
jgi:hypothetical protein